MNHTFLLQPAVWTVTGSFKELQVTGKTTVFPRDGKWIIDSFIQLENGAILQTDYSIVPLKEACASTSFTATSTVLGAMVGTFTIKDNKIIEDYGTDNPAITGQEIMTMLDESHYISEGILYHQGISKSSWSLTFTKIP